MCGVLRHPILVISITNISTKVYTWHLHRSGNLRVTPCYSGSTLYRKFKARLYMSVVYNKPWKRIEHFESRHHLMGNQLNCLAHCQTRQERLLILQNGSVSWVHDIRVVYLVVCYAVGAYFKRKKTILGLNTGTERVHVKLDGDGHTCVEMRPRWRECW